MNISDSERIAAVLEKEGLKPASQINEANLMVINMCSVRQSAVNRVFGKISNIRKLHPIKSGEAGVPLKAGQFNRVKTILTGCLLKKDKKKLSSLFDYVLDIKDLQKWPDILGIGKKLNIKDYFKITPKISSFTSLIPIMTGCDNFCSYCVVPYVRGREISRPAKEIISEIKSALKNNAKEIWLLGQNVNSYGVSHRSTQIRKQINTDIKFPELLVIISKIPGKFWIRFTSSHPKDFSDELIKVMAKNGKITPYLNLPIQTGDDKILRKMNRPYTTKQYKNLVKKIREKIPDITLSTDVIVGFPGETKKQFENTVRLFKEIKFDMAYISEYSPRSGTTAIRIKDNVFLKEKTRRKNALNEILKKTALKRNKKFIGRKVKVLVENNKKGSLFGKSKEYKTVKFKGSENLIGRFVNVKIIDASPWGLIGLLN